MEKIKVFIVDDSAIVRELLTEHLSKYNDIEIVGSAPDAYIARQKIVKTKVDVITLDIEMPKMDGLTFLGHLMKSYPIPAIIVSSLVKDQHELILKAFDLGAVEVVPKPGGPYSVFEVIEILADKIRAASKIKKDLVFKKQKHLKVPSKNILAEFQTTKKILAIGASTGGTIAFEKLFKSFSKDMPPTLAVIHMPENFTNSFAARLNSFSAVTIKEAVDNERIYKGHIYIAPGNYHMSIKTMGTDYILKVKKGPRVNKHRPAVDVLFESVSNYVGKNSCGVLLTGMGRDGANGLLKMKQKGAYTIAQDEASSIVYGMPKEAAELGAACDIVSLDLIYNKIVDSFVNV